MSTKFLARARRCAWVAIASAWIVGSTSNVASAQDVRPRPEPEEPQPAAAVAPPPTWERDRGRRGIQLELQLGATACLPANAACGIGGAGLGGVTLPSFGMGFNLGWRVNPYFVFGGAYRFGMFHPGSDMADTGGYQFGHQHSFYAVARPIFPVGRVDLGIDLGPGYSIQVFERQGNDREYAQGFSMIIGPTVDVFLTDRFFIGAKIDFLLNAHYRVCTVLDGSTSCAPPGPTDVAPVHQVIYGIHLGGTFGG
jgi:hypothetical protein